jgi:hypothetical protein
MQMNPRTDWPRKLISIAMIAAGIYFLIANHLRVNSNSVALGAEIAEAAPLSQTPGAMPSFEHAKVESRTVSGSLTEELSRWAKASSDPQWLGYSVAAISSDRVICCGGNNNWNGNYGCGKCELEDHKHGESFTTTSSNKAELEAPRRVVVLYRATAGALDKIRVVSDVCVIDAGGLRVTWLDGVNPAQSVEYLSALVRGKYEDDHSGEKLPHGALTAIAMHGDTSADKALNSFIEPSQPESLRKQTVFWLGEARGASGFQTLKQLARTEKSSEVRAQITFALSLNREPGALDEMIRMAKEDESTHVRGQALFWLAQKAEKKAAGAITGAIENDPDTEVKKKAVFALSQMPREEGVPKLIQVAQTNKNPEVRKQAMFWLGQSHDPRALEFFEQILTK